MSISVLFTQKTLHNRGPGVLLFFAKVAMDPSFTYSALDSSHKFAPKIIKAHKNSWSWAIDLKFGTMLESTKEKLLMTWIWENSLHYGRKILKKFKIDLLRKSKISNLLSNSVTLAVFIVKFPFCYFLCNVCFLKKFFECFYNCGNLKLQFGLIFKILIFDFGVKFAKYLKKPMFFKSPISQHSLIEKFQK
jgi:hypothetical protein